MKYFRIPYDEILHKRSYMNILLLNASIPTHGAESGDAADGKGEKSTFRHANEIFDQLL